MPSVSTNELRASRTSPRKSASTRSIAPAGREPSWNDPPAVSFEPALNENASTGATFQAPSAGSWRSRNSAPLRSNASRTPGAKALARRARSYHPRTVSMREWWNFKGLRETLMDAIDMEASRPALRDA